MSHLFLCAAPCSGTKPQGGARRVVEKRQENKMENNSLLYRQMKLVYDNGYASRDEIIKDAEILGLDKTLVEGFFDDISEEDVEEDDIELTQYISELWRTDV